MEVQGVLQGLDQLFASHRIGEVENYLLAHMEQAKGEQDFHCYITLLNEMIGFCRDTSQYEKAVSYCKLVEQEIKNQNLEGSVAHATTLLNIANAYRAASLLEESMENYNKVFPIYDKVLEKTDFRYASLYNNLSLLYQEMNNYEKACECLQNALGIVVLYEEARIELAVTHTNLAMSLLKLGKDKKAEEHLKTAFTIFEQDEDKDYHYSAALSAMSQLQYKKGDLKQAIFYGEQALVEIERNVGRTKAYEVVQENISKMKEELQKQTIQSNEKKDTKQDKKQDKKQDAEIRNATCNTTKNEIQEGIQELSEQRMECLSQNVEGNPMLKGMELCKAYYEAYKEDFLKDFQQYKQYMAFGLLGDGSDCLGLDDEHSQDHDYGPGFCVFIPEKLYDTIGKELEQAYNGLPKEFMGYTRTTTNQGMKRVGVKTIEAFYREYIGVPDIPQTEGEWLLALPERFRAATSGEIFDDYYGEFTRIQEGLKQFYPEYLYKKMLANELSMMAQTGQYNYGRMLSRGEKVTVQYILAKYMEHTMNVVYLLNKEYPPFYKWKHKAMTNLPILPEIMDILNAIADMEYGDERIPLVIEIIAKLIVEELKKQKLTTKEELYLDGQAHEILK